MKKRNLSVLLALLLLLCACDTAPETEKNGEEAALRDYTFSFRWNVCGISSYDSESGLLVKTTDATNPSRYRTTHILTAAEREEIGALLASLDLSAYPAEYDPFNAPDAELRQMTSPDQTIVLSFVTPSFSKTVSCPNVCLGMKGGYDEAAQRFLNVCGRLEEILTSTEEWKSLPDYEFLYD
ncbi:MAG: hypothetical protein IJR89_09065 [Clostridia bacterium]|nr:hypothetical protein [Clostridia bacterium]